MHSIWAPSKVFGFQTKKAERLYVEPEGVLAQSGLSEVFSEVEIVSLLSHRYIIELKEVFETRAFFIPSP